jgi:hypothetical protein
MAKPVCMKIPKPSYYAKVTLLKDGLVKHGFKEGRNTKDGTIVWIKGELGTFSITKAEFLYPKDNYQVYDYYGRHIYTISNFEEDSEDKNLLVEICSNKKTQDESDSSSDTESKKNSYAKTLISKIPKISKPSKLLHRKPDQPQEKHQLKNPISQSTKHNTTEDHNIRPLVQKTSYSSNKIGKKDDENDQKLFLEYLCKEMLKHGYEHDLNSGMVKALCCLSKETLDKIERVLDDN